MSIQSNRIEKLKKILSDPKQALLINDENNIFYYSGFYKSEGVLLITFDKSYLLVDFRYYEAALNKVVDCEVVQFKLLTTTIRELLQKHGIESLLIEAEHITLATYQKYLKAFNEVGVSLESSESLDKYISNQRIIKSVDEVQFIEEAQKITEKAYSEVLNYIKPGIPEISISNELEYLMKKYGAGDISFDLITITGKKTSLPHGVPGNDLICEGDFFTMDIGALYNGYHSDMTRTVAVKRYSAEMKKIYDIVYNAQISALSKVRAGVRTCEIDKTARDIISNAGFGDCFGHSTGHGVGLNIHEAPNVSPNSETILSEGMIITVEPGIYIENKFGVRIEDMILVKNDGYKNFATLSKQLIVV